MKTLKARMIILLSGIFLNNEIDAQKNGLVTETFSVEGNCGMCKKTIETAALVRGVKNAAWDESKKLLAIKYDKQKTGPETVLRSVAYAGYDNERYLAPTSAYDQLHGCCQYERKGQAIAETAAHENHTSTTEPMHKETAPAITEKQTPEDKETGSESYRIKIVYDNYFQIKDALVRTNATSSSESARKLLTSINAVNMESLKGKEHDVYMKFVSKLKADAKIIAENKNIEKQRSAFTTLSNSLFELMQVIKPGYEVYLDHCPMYNDGKGADWISREKAIKNPYYGSKMLTCGNVKETIK